MKNARQNKILELIEKYDIDTQEALVERLSAEGYSVTQTTASRDIRELKLVKGISAQGTYKYVLPEVKKDKSSPVLNSQITDSVIKIDYAHNLVVVKTLPGMANAIGVCIDSLEIAEIIGSVAGDDTILIVLREDEIAANATAKLKEVFGI